MRMTKVMKMKFSEIIKDWIFSFISVLFPNLCEVCDTTLVRGEKVMCTHCLLEMPRIKDCGTEPNSVERKCFVSGCCVRGTALFKYFRNDRYSEIVRQFKYHGRKKLAEDMGKILALEKAGTGFFEGIDYLVPVPMHYWKKFGRGYNQAEEICRGIRSVTSIPLAFNLYAKKGHKTQTHKSAEERLKNTENIFDVKNPKELADKHIALVDDVITTGSTMQHCAMILRDSVPGIKISFIAVASTGL